MKNLGWTRPGPGILQATSPSLFYNRLGTLNSSREGGQNRPAGVGAGSGLILLTGPVLTLTDPRPTCTYMICPGSTEQNPPEGMAGGSGYGAMHFWWLPNIGMIEVLIIDAGKKITVAATDWVPLSVMIRLGERQVNA